MYHKMNHFVHRTLLRYMLNILSSSLGILVGRPYYIESYITCTNWWQRWDEPHQFLCFKTNNNDNATIFMHYNTKVK